jgi:hypothetical protein
VFVCEAFTQQLLIAYYYKLFAYSAILAWQRALFIDA